MGESRRNVLSRCAAAAMMLPKRQRCSRPVVAGVPDWPWYTPLRVSDHDLQLQVDPSSLQ
jgi:hypothetical protein